LSDDEAVNNNDAAALAALYAEDALFVADTGPLYGRQAIDNFYADAFKVLHPKNYISKEDPNSARFVGTPDNVASNGELSFTSQGDTGEPSQIKGYWAAINTHDGVAWRIRMMTFNVNPSAC
jgi:uncharacterized protein (TIGR02246 family)